MHSILAIDFGSETITAALVPAGLRQAAVLYIDDEPTIGSHVCIDAYNELRPATHPDPATPRVTGLARALGQPPTVIYGAPRTAATMIATAIEPAVTQAISHGAPVGLIVATHPPEWTEAMLTDFTLALSAHADTILLTPWADAIAAQSSKPEHGHVTNLDFGANSATITIVGFPNRGLPAVKYTHTDPRGGSAGLNRAIVEAIATSVGATITSVDAAWRRSALDEISRVRQLPGLEQPGAVVTAHLPAPIGPVPIAARSIRDIATRHMETVISGLITRPEVSSVWAADRSTHHPRPAVALTGGFAADPAVELAAQTIIGPVSIIKEPAHAAAYGAALIGLRSAGKRKSRR